VQALLANGITGIEVSATIESMFTEGVRGYYTSFEPGDTILLSQLLSLKATIFIWDPLSGAVANGATIVKPLWATIDEDGEYVPYTGTGRWLKASVEGTSEGGEIGDLTSLYLIPSTAPVAVEGTIYFDGLAHGLYVAVGP